MERFLCRILSVSTTAFAVARLSRKWYSFLQASVQNILSERPFTGALQSRHFRCLPVIFVFLQGANLPGRGDDKISGARYVFHI